MLDFVIAAWVIHVFRKRKANAVSSIGVADRETGAPPTSNPSLHQVLRGLRWHSLRSSSGTITRISAYSSQRISYPQATNSSSNSNGPGVLGSLLPGRCLDSKILFVSRSLSLEIPSSFLPESSSGPKVFATAA